jgi:hypothetical protein
MSLLRNGPSGVMIVSSGTSWSNIIVMCLRKIMHTNILQSGSTLSVMVVSLAICVSFVLSVNDNHFLTSSQWYSLFSFFGTQNGFRVKTLRFRLEETWFKFQPYPLQMIRSETHFFFFWLELNHRKMISEYYRTQ